MKKISVKKWHFVLLLLLIAGLAVYFLTPSLENIVQKVVHKYGSQVTGTEVNLGGFRLALLDGEVELSELSVGNPKNYTQPHIMSVGKIAVKVNVKSIFDNTVVVENIRIEKPEVTYEMLSVTRNNISELLENIKNNTAAAAKDAEPDSAGAAETKADEPKSAGKKVVINNIDVVDGNINFAASLAGHAASASVPLPAINMKDIGKEKSNRGMNPVEAASAVLKKIFNAAYDTAIKSKLVDLKDVAETGMNKVVESVKEKSGLKGWFGLGK